MAVRKFTGLQRDVLHLYRQWIRLAFQKPSANRQNFLNYIHLEFHKNRDLRRKDFTTIEYLIRNGQKKLKTFQNPNLKNIH
ncbi:hypothetical protein KAFR_0E03740 [Kazachstania africana CBS 2517]|uniref:Complex 1 LYR protein domain-containing protein n=1 Tax=Kazachstania africana (strain ATCC 22294 / BCRC 22015 / CBS 2517 / CECT 1963 / NBRC 1671 / NRRL Y-8276) TaxID=1071382 RepID=H2AVX5_KAZAF|nr:hypothetical protein KAFR_0E03740 [Kazachstania africana CBS 2517]CCF58525.1 hypothetical protein KAFR_0E03740 [Kazachstania africana CBS 2517]